MSAELHGLPKTIGRYEIKSLLGRGGLGRVLLATDPMLQRDVALKLIEPNGVAPESLAEIRFMFHREARATAALRHPGIVEFYDYSGPDADLLFIACERIEGPTLRAVLEQRKRLSAVVATALGYEIARALEHAHAQRVVHRDIKPENIFWLDSGRIVLSDFGIAKAFGGGTQLGGTVQFGPTNIYGSPAYMAPEQLTGAEVGPQTDLHALGALLFEALTGRQAFDGPDLEAILEAVSSDVRPSLDESAVSETPLRSLVDSLLRKDPNERPGSATEVAQSLRQCLDRFDVTDARDCLRDFGEGTATVTQLAGDDEEPAELFYTPPPVGIHVERSDGTMKKLAARGPFLFAMAGIAVVISAGLYLMLSLGNLPSTGEIIPGPGKPPPVLLLAENVYVLLRFPGKAEIWVDEERQGAWRNQVRLSVRPGRHKFIIRFATGDIEREAFLVKGTDPVFDFMPPREENESP